MCMGIPLQVQTLGDDGFALCTDASGATYDLPIHTALLDVAPKSGDWLLTHIDTAIRPLDDKEARLIANALEAVDRAARGENFEHLLGDLLDREPQLPPHLQDTINQDTINSG
ncbi:unnamed protein product [Ectocarpus sp. 12 AP-2014]